jgi:hypothetical protein
MQTGVIRRQGEAGIIGTWQADAEAIRVDTTDPELRDAADRVLTTPQVIPVHGPERFEFAGPAETTVRAPASIQLLAFFALEMESRGFEVTPDEV